jgi:hypothetical protein
MNYPQRFVRANLLSAAKPARKKALLCHKDISSASGGEK